MKEEKPKADKENIPEQLRPYLEAKANETLPQYFLDRFKYRRDRVKTLPNPEADIGNDKWGNYIVGFSLDLRIAVRDGVINDPELIQRIKQFSSYDFKFKHGEFTTQQEIDMVNQILAGVIQYLEEVIGGI